jgi:hypothetical protein
MGGTNRMGILQVWWRSRISSCNVLKGSSLLWQSDNVWDVEGDAEFIIFSSNFCYLPLTIACFDIHHELALLLLGTSKRHP